MRWWRRARADGFEVGGRGAYWISRMVSGGVFSCSLVVLTCHDDLVATAL